MTRSRTSRATLASVRGGRFSELPAPEFPARAPEPEDPERDRADDARREGFAVMRSDSDPEREEDVVAAPMLPAEDPRDAREEEAEVLPLEKSEAVEVAVAAVEREEPVAGDDDEEDRPEDMILRIGCRGCC